MNRRRKKIRFVRRSKIIFVIAPLLIVLIIFLIFRANFLTVKENEVVGDNLSCADINQLKNSGLLNGLNFLSLDKQKIINNFKKQFICIKSINLSRVFPNKIKMEVLSRKPAVILITLNDKPSSASALIEHSIATPSAKEIENSFFVDDEGVVFSKTSNETNIPEIYTYDMNISVGQKLTDLISDVINILNKAKSFGLEAKKSWLINDYYILQSESRESGNALKIVFQLNKTINIQLASLQLILTEAKMYTGKLEFIDLRFDKPIIKLAPKK